LEAGVHALKFVTDISKATPAPFRCQEENHKILGLSQVGAPRNGDGFTEGLTIHTFPTGFPQPDLRASLGGAVEIYM
jgi:hypothetical protein